MVLHYHHLTKTVFGLITVALSQPGWCFTWPDLSPHFPTYKLTNPAKISPSFINLSCLLLYSPLCCRISEEEEYLTAAQSLPYLWSTFLLKLIMQIINKYSDLILTSVQGSGRREAGQVWGGETVAGTDVVSVRAKLYLCNWQFLVVRNMTWETRKLICPSVWRPADQMCGSLLVRLGQGQVCSTVGQNWWSGLATKVNWSFASQLAGSGSVSQPGNL